MVFSHGKKIFSSLQPFAIAMAMTTSIAVVAGLLKRLKIDGFCTTGTMGDDDCIRSGRCTIDGYEWEICVYPARTAGSPGGNKWVALRLVFLSEPRTPVVRANLYYRVVHPNPGYTTPLEKESGVFRRPKDSTSFVYLVSVSDVVNSGYLEADSLTVECAILVLNELPEPTIPGSKEMTVPSYTLSQHLGELLQSGMGADVTFLVSGESFAVHKNILAARSPVFKDNFFGDGDAKVECSGGVEIKDMEATVFRAMLGFIYTDTVPEFEKQEEAVMAQHLFAAADRFGLERLKLICIEKLSGSIGVDTVATTLALAEQHRCSQLKAECVEFILSTPAILDVVMATDGYKHLESSCPFVVIDLLKAARGRKI